jgi:opacity protein-like surface antigen
LCLLAAGLLVAAVAVAPAHAQKAPVPDPPAEEHRKQMTERYRGLLSRLSTTAQTTYAPSFQSGLGIGVSGVEADLRYELYPGHALHAMLGVRQHRTLGDRSSSPLRRTVRGSFETIGTASLGYEASVHRLARLFGSRARSVHARRASLTLTGGLAVGDFAGATVALAPRYTIPVTQHWHLPIGFTVGHVALDTDPFGGPSARFQRTFVGVSIGVRILYGTRDRLYLE